MPKREKPQAATRGAGVRRPPSRCRKDAAPPSAAAIEAALAGLAHDIRTPLTGIVAFAELLAASDLPEREMRWAQAIRSAGEHLAQLTTLVVDAAKAEATGLVLRETAFSLHDFVGDAEASLSARAQAKGLAMSASVEPALPERCVGDQVRLRSALENLFDNAVRFTERGAVRLEVAARVLARGKLRVTFTISDTGMGIAAADLKRLMKPFTQASDDIARRFGGAGLGLVSVERIARAMGGRLTVASTPGEGSRFNLSVLLRASTPAPAPAAGEDAIEQARPLRVLCVEDNPYGRVVLQVMLRELGHEVSFAPSGEAALDALRRRGFKVDAVLMDLALPGIDGLETVRRIRALRGPMRRIPVIGVSGRTADDDVAKAKATGMNAYLRKPPSAQELRAALAAVTIRRR